MNDNYLVTLLIVFVLGYFAHQMMKNMCVNRLFEGNNISVGDNVIQSTGDQWKLNNGLCQDCFTKGNDCHFCLQAQYRCKKCGSSLKETCNAYSTNCDK